MVRGDAGQRAAAICPFRRSAEHVTTGKCLIFYLLCIVMKVMQEIIRAAVGQGMEPTLKKGMRMWSIQFTGWLIEGTVERSNY